MVSQVHLVLSPKLLPPHARFGRTVLVDVAFAHGRGYLDVTRPFISGLGDRLVRWIDHHPHAGWSEFGNDQRFLLVDKRRAPACPELITESLVAELGPFDDVIAHADFDGCVAAAKLKRLGLPPYPEADADARAVDAPGHGFVCSPRGERLAFALDRARGTMGGAGYLRLLRAWVDALVRGDEPADLAAELDELAAAQRGRLAELDRLAEAATRPHPDVLLLTVSESVSVSDKKALLRVLEERARVAMVAVGSELTLGTYDDSIDLGGIDGIEVAGGLAWGRGDPREVLRQLLRRVS